MESDGVREGAGERKNRAKTHRLCMRENKRVAQSGENITNKEPYAWKGSRRRRPDMNREGDVGEECPHYIP